MSLTNAQLSADIAALLNRVTLWQNQYDAWQGGSATGGPNDDGRYPLTDEAGATRLVYSPAALEAALAGPRHQAETFAEVAEMARQAAQAASTLAAQHEEFAETARTAAQAARDLTKIYRDQVEGMHANVVAHSGLVGANVAVMAADRVLAQTAAANASSSANSATSSALAAASSAANAATFNPALFDLKTDSLSSMRLTGMIDPARIPVLVSQYPVVSSGGIANLSPAQQAGIGPGTIVATTDGRRWVYSGSGSKTAEASFIEQGDVTPVWDAVANKPYRFQSNVALVDGLQTVLDSKLATASLTWAAIVGKPSTFPADAHSHAWSEITGKPSTFTATAHVHPISEVTGLQSALDAKLNLSGGTLTGNLRLSTGADRSIVLGSSSNYTYQLISAGDHFQIREAEDPSKIRMQIAYPNGNVSFGSATITAAGNTMWHAGNDGAGSGLDADLLDGMNSSAVSAANTIVARDANGRTSIKGIDFGLSPSDLLNDAPYYGVGRSNITTFGGSGSVMQMSGYYGVRVRGQNAILDLYQNGRGYFSGGSFSVMDGPVNATKGVIDYSREDNSSRPARVLIPEGGVSVGNPSVTTGAIKIRLPAAMNNSNTMLTFTVVVFEYTTGMTKRFHLAGYNYSNTWVNVSARQDGDAQSASYMIRYGHDGVSNCMWIGETATTWSYPQVSIMDVTLGYSGYSNEMARGWSVGFVTAFDTVTGSRSAAVSWTTANDGSGSGLDADYLDGYHAASFAWRNSWSSAPGTDLGVVETLRWRNYGTGHVITDVSSTGSPSGTTVDRVNAAIPWAAGYPTLMGWNGSSTYGVRVDSARTADTLSGEVSMSGGLTAATFYTGNWFRSSGNTGWFNSTHAVGVYSTGSGTVRTYNGAHFYSEGNVTAAGSVTAVGQVYQNNGANRVPVTTYSQSAPSGGVDGDVHIIW